MLPNLKNENEFLVTKKLDTCIVINGKSQKSRKRVRFAVDDNIEHTKRIGRINILSSKHKDCRLNSINLSEIETMENLKFQSKLLCSNKYNDSYLDHMGYPSKIRHYSFNRLNANESQQNIFKFDVIKDYSFSKNPNNMQPEKENEVNIEGDSAKVSLSHDHLLHENGLKIFEAKNNKDLEVTNIMNSREQNKNKSNKIHAITTYNSFVSSPTNFECNSSLGSRTCEDTHNTRILNIAMFKSNLNRVVRRYRMKQKKFENAKLP